MKYFDQIGHEFELPLSPKRIISLVPSQTELLYDLGLGEQVVGITKFCIHPQEWFKSKARVGGTKKINFDKIAALNPDLIIANKEENTKEEIEYLQNLYPVFTSNISNLEESLIMIKSLGEIVGKTQESIQLISDIETKFKELSGVLKPKNPTVLYLIWEKPYMSIGKDTFIDDMLNRCGFNNIISENKRYPEISEKELIEFRPDYIFLSSEPYPFKEKHVFEFQKIAPKSKIILVDGEYFSWYGSRLSQSSQYFIDLIDNLP